MNGRTGALWANEELPAVHVFHSCTTTTIASSDINCNIVTHGLLPTSRIGPHYITATGIPMRFYTLRPTIQNFRRPQGAEIQQRAFFC